VLPQLKEYSAVNPPDSDRYEFFISYAEADRAWAEGYWVDALAAAGVNLIHAAAFIPGRPWIEEFQRAVTQSKRVLLIISAAYVADELSNYVNLLAQQFGVDSNSWPVIPIIREDDVVLPPRLAMLVALRATNESEADAAVSRLLADLQRERVPARIAPDCPYPGMRPFSEDDSRYFFGRSAEIEALELRLDAEPLVMVVGPSGSGKSSLIMAGLLPRLKDIGWSAVTFRPGTLPTTTRLRETLAEFVDWNSHTRLDESSSLLLVVIDQLEELFTQTNERTEQDALISDIKALVAISGVRLVLTFRADFYGALMTSSLWETVQHRRLEITPLTSDQLREAIMEPAEEVQVFVEPALVERLVADAADEPGMLPFVQETLVLLWQKLERRYLPLRAYEALVITHKSYVTDGRTGLLVAMGVRADAALNGLDSQGQTIARRTFLRLVQFGEGRSDTRRQQSEQALMAEGDDPAQLAGVLEYLVDQRLLTTSGKAGEKTRMFDLAHEAMIAGWPRFHQWIEDRRLAEQTRRRLETKAAEWVILGRQGGGRLDEAELPEAKRWLSGQDAKELGVSSELLALVDYSDTLLRAEEKAREEAHERDLAQQRTIRRRLYMVLGLVTTLLAVTLVGVFLVNQERIRANLNAEKARTRELIAQAQAVQQEENLLPLSMFLAIEAFQNEQNAAAEEILRQGLAVLPQPLAFAQHTKFVDQVAFSPDGVWMASTGEDGVVHIVNAATGEPIDELRHSAAVYALTFRPDGRQLATGAADGAIKLWALPTLQQMGTMRQVERVQEITYAPDNTWLASTDKAGIAHIWDSQTQEKLLDVIHDKRVNSVAASPDSRWVLTASDDGTAQIWDVDSREQITHVSQPPWVNRAVFRFDGATFVTAGSDATARIWDSRTGAELVRFVHDEPLSDVAFSPDGALLATASEDDTARIWDTMTGKELLRVRHEGDVNRVQFDTRGTTILTASQDGTARLWEVASGREIMRMTHADGVRGIAFNGEHPQLATGSQDGTARSWAIPSQGVTVQNDADIWDADFAPDGHRIATASQDTSGLTAWVWNAETGEQIVRLPDHRIWVSAVAFSPNGRELATGDNDGNTRIWELSPVQELARFSEPDGVTALTYRKDGSELATGNLSGEVRIWSPPSTDAKQQLFYPGAGEITDLAYANDGRSLLISDKRGVARIQNLLDWTQALEVSHDGKPVNSVAFSPDERHFATAGADRTVRIWDSESGDEVMPRLVHRDEVLAVAWSPDNKWLASGAADGTLRLWDAETGHELFRIQYPHPVTVVEFNNDGRSLLVVSNKVAEVWNVSEEAFVRSDRLIETVCARLTRNLSHSEWEEYFPGAKYRQTCPDLPEESGIESSG